MSPPAREFANPSSARSSPLSPPATPGGALTSPDPGRTSKLPSLSSGGLDGLRDMNDAIKGFVARAVTVLSSDLGIRQYLHIAKSTPTTGMVHHIATTTTELA